MDNTTKLKTLAELSLCDGVTVSNEGNRYDFLEADIKASDHDDAYTQSKLLGVGDFLNDKMVISEDTFEASGWVDFSDAERAEFHRLQQCLLANRDQLDLFNESAQCPDCDGSGKLELRTDVGAYDVLRCRTCDGRGDIQLSDALLEEREAEFEMERRGLLLLP